MVSRLILVAVLSALSACASGPQQPAPATEVEQHEPAPVAPAEGVQSATASLVEAAQHARQQGDYDRAAGLLQRAQRIDSRAGSIYLELAHLYLAQGKTEQAQVVADRGLSYCAGAVCTQLRSLR